MNSLVRNLGPLLASVALAGAVCILVSYQVVGPAGALGALLASTVCLLTGVVVLGFIHRFGTGVKSVLASTGLRVGLVALVGALVYFGHGGLEPKTYLLSLGATYVAALAAETWAVYGIAKTATGSHPLIQSRSRVEAR